MFRDQEGLTYAHETIRRLKEEAETAWIDDRGSIFNQDVIGAIELDYMLDVAETIVVGALERASRAARSSASTSPSATTTSGSSTSRSPSTATDAPTVSYSPVTMTQWEPQERTY